MALSTQIGLFIAISLVYIGFTFAWAWYKGREEDGDIDDGGTN